MGTVITRTISEGTRSDMCPLTKLDIQKGMLYMRQDCSIIERNEDSFDRCDGNLDSAARVALLRQRGTRGATGSPHPDK